MESKGAVVVAALANLAIAIFKYFAAAVGGSAALLAEAIHSTVDTCDQLLVLFGMQRSRKPADELHPFGYGQELYFWTLIVAVLFFGLGGGMSVLEGVYHLLYGSRLEDPAWSYAALGVAAVAESVSFSVGVRKLNARRHGRSFWRTFRESKEPAVLTVVVEDAAALMGLALAFLGVLLSHALHLPALDSIAAICIGAVQATMAMLLARESRSLLVGESAGKEVMKRMREVIARDPAVERVGAVSTMHFGPEQILVNAEIQFQRGLSSQSVERAVDALEKEIRKVEPRARRIFIEMQTVDS